ncbi:MAG: hypothetical protein GF349_00920 [Candidatus Magasanikbacteria bacterium]|nr:hypothetical protein [Candidatus Magasanikbacteria bacterium]
MEETKNIIQEISPPFVSLAKFTPLPGTPMYQVVVEAGLLDEEDTDWSWAANQSLERSFVLDMDQKDFLSLANGLADFVKNHNEQQSSKRSDPRLKVL